MRASYNLILISSSIFLAGCNTAPLGNYVEDSSNSLSTSDRLVTICWPGGGIGYDKHPIIELNGQPVARLTIGSITEIVVPKTNNEFVFRHDSWRGKTLSLRIDNTTESNAHVLFGVNLKSSFVIPTPWFFYAGGSGTWNVAPTTAEKIKEACEKSIRIRIRPKR